uniref:Uncharacterized protein n=1 Tax=Arundo donax TaxID=35708 RepID=A0A0A8YY99_ARUDO
MEVVCVVVRIVYRL